ncbi:MAG: type IV secretion protein IcmC [Pseudomonadota bacterium]
MPYLNTKLLLLVFLCTLLVGCSGTAPNAQQMLINLSDSYPNIWRLITATLYVLGFLLIFKALYNLKVYGEARTAFSTQSNMRQPMIWTAVGVMMIYSPTAFQSFMLTSFGDTNIMSYREITVTGWDPNTLRALVGFIQIIGLISFFRGLVLLSKLAENTGQQGSLPKSLFHLAGGVLAINIVGTIKVLQNTLGFS